MGSKKRKGEKGAEGAMGCPKKADAVAVTNELRNSRKNTNQRKYWIVGSREKYRGPVNQNQFFGVIWSIVWEGA